MKRKLYYRILNAVLFSLLGSIFFAKCYSEELPRVDLSISTDSPVFRDSEQISNLSVAVSAMISPSRTFHIYKELINYISDRLGKPIIFKQRKTYREVNELLRKGELDFAFVCTGAYKIAKQQFPLELLLVPEVNSKPFYQAYIIVNEESGINSLEELEGKSFAYTDPLSNTGHDYILKYLKSINTSDKTFFSKTIFTFAHDYSIQAVSKGFTDAATVDGLVFDYLEKKNPEMVKNINIIHKSKYFGIPPVVVRPNLNGKLKTQLRKIMLEMHSDSTGAGILAGLMIDRFVVGKDTNYD